MGDLSEVELWILRYMNQTGSDERLTAADIAPNVGLSTETTTDRLNELEWVGYVEEHEGADGSLSAFSLTADGAEAANA
jgi:DNA-binding IclR family transcriptional regulator